MKISDLVEMEASNESIILHREGIFWSAYEVSAYLFIEHIKPYDVKGRYYKKLKQDVVFIGFPDNVLNSIMEPSHTKGYKILLLIRSIYFHQNNGVSVFQFE